DGDVRRARDLGHGVDVLALDRLFDEHRLVRLARLDEHLRGLRLDRPMAVDADVDIGPARLAQLRETLGGRFYPRGILDDARRLLLRQAGLERAEALRVTRAELIGSPRMRVDPHAPSRRTAEELVDRDAERLALDVPERLLNATESAGENRPAAI